MKRQVRNDPLAERLTNAPSQSVVDATDELMSYKQGGAEVVEPQVIYQDREVPVPTAIVTDETGTHWLGGYGITPRGLRLDKDRPITADEWLQLIPTIHTIQSAYQWIIGDWCNMGERKWGKTYDEMAALVNRDKETLYNWASVCRNIKFSRRRELSFSHHIEVTAVESPDIQDLWLEKAVVTGWSRNKLRDMIATTGGDISQLESLTDGNDPTPLPRDPFDRYHRAAAPFYAKTRKIMQKAQKATRFQVAKELRELADEIENSQ